MSFFLVDVWEVGPGDWGCTLGNYGKKVPHKKRKLFLKLIVFYLFPIIFSPASVYLALVHNAGNF